jgi:hypothetical protein
LRIARCGAESGLAAEGGKPPAGLGAGIAAAGGIDVRAGAGASSGAGAAGGGDIKAFSPPGVGTVRHGGGGTFDAVAAIGALGAVDAAAPGAPDPAEPHAARPSIRRHVKVAA